METVTHRELRNRSGEVLRRVAAGARLLITNRGRPVAQLVPPPVGEHSPSQDPAEEHWGNLVRAGLVQPAASPTWEGLPEPLKLDGPPAEELLAQLRG